MQTAVTLGALPRRTTVLCGRNCHFGSITFPHAGTVRSRDARRPRDFFHIASGCPIRLEPDAAWEIGSRLGRRDRKRLSAPPFDITGYSALKLVHFSAAVAADFSLSAARAMEGRTPPDPSLIRAKIVGGGRAQQRARDNSLQSIRNLPFSQLLVRVILNAVAGCVPEAGWSVYPSGRKPTILSIPATKPVRHCEIATLGMRSQVDGLSPDVRQIAGVVC